MKKTMLIPRRKNIFFILCLFIFVVGISLRINNLSSVIKRTPDEAIYTYQAKSIAQDGIMTTKLLIKQYNLSEKLWTYPPPARIGYLWLVAGIMKITDNFGLNIGSYISCTFSIISLLLLILLGLRFFNHWIALYALLFMSVSPMELAIARRTWQDAFIGCIGLSLIYFCCEITRNSNKIIWYITLVIIGSYCILIKESGIIIYGLCIFWVSLVLFVKEKRWLRGLFFMISVILGIGISAFTLIYHVGGIEPLLTAFKHVKETMPTNTYAVEYQSGPWYSFPYGFWMLSPLNAMLCFIGVLIIPLYNKLVSKKASPIFGIIFFMIIFFTIATFTPYCQNLRYVSVLFVPFYLISGLGFWAILLAIKSIFKKSYHNIINIFFIGMLSIVALNDYLNFEKIFTIIGTPDLSPRLIKESLQYLHYIKTPISPE